MTYHIGDNAFAIKTADEWILKPICDSIHLDTGVNGMVVRTGGDWVLTPAARVEMNDNAITVRDPANDPILLPLGCKDEEDNCVGQDPYCTNCPCADRLKETYTITFSGFPEICMADEFNGSWEVTWEQDCIWSANIGGARNISISLVSNWSVGWFDSMPGGPGGAFYSATSGNCGPDTIYWAPYLINEPDGCDGLTDEWLDNATCVIS